MALCRPSTGDLRLGLPGHNNNRARWPVGAIDANADGVLADDEDVSAAGGFGKQGRHAAPTNDEFGFFYPRSAGL